MNALRNSARCHVHELAEELKISESRIRTTVETLVASGLIEAGGNGRGRYYMLSSKYYKKTKNTVAYIRQKDIDPIRHEELVLALLKKKGDVKRADVVDLLHVTEPQAFRILKKMADANKIRLVGSGAGSKYVLN